MEQDNKEKQFLEAVKNNKAEEFLSNLNILELLNLRYRLGITRIGATSLEELSEEKRHYKRLIDKEKKSKMKRR